MRAGSRANVLAVALILFGAAGRGGCGEASGADNLILYSQDHSAMLSEAFKAAQAGAASGLTIASSETGLNNLTALSNFARNVSLLPDESARADLAVVSGATSFNPLQAAVDNGISFSRVLSGRADTVMGQLRAAGEKFGAGSVLAAENVNQDRVNRVWVASLGTWADRADKDGVPGYSYGSGGVILGYDRVAGNFFGGFGLGYEGGTLDTRDVDDDNRVGTYSFGLYGGYRGRSGFFSKVLAGYGHGDNRTTEYVNSLGGWRGADYASNALMLGNIAGLDIPVRGFTFTPTIGLIGQTATSGSYTTTGVLSQRFDDARVSSLTLPLDLAVSYTKALTPVSSLTFSANSGYTRELHGRDPSGTMKFLDAGINPVRIRGAMPGRDSMVFGTGVTYKIGEFEFGASYNYDGTSTSDNHRLNGTFGVTF